MAPKTYRDPGKINKHLMGNATLSKKDLPVSPEPSIPQRLPLQCHQRGARKRSAAANPRLVGRPLDGKMTPYQT